MGFATKSPADSRPRAQVWNTGLRRNDQTVCQYAQHSRSSWRVVDNLFSIMTFVAGP